MEPHAAHCGGTTERPCVTTEGRGVQEGAAYGLVQVGATESAACWCGRMEGREREAALRDGKRGRKIGLVGVARFVPFTW